MKKTIKILKWVWSAFLAFIIVSLVVYAMMPSHHDLASDPKNIEKILKLDLPDIKHVDSEDNLERGASRWDCYIHHIQFVEPLSKDCIKELERRCMEDTNHWKKNGQTGCFIYMDDDNGDEYSVSCSVCSEHSVLEYNIDEDEGIMLFLIDMLVFLALLILSVAYVAFYVAFKVIKAFIHKRHSDAE